MPRRHRSNAETDWQGYRHPAMDYQKPKLLRRVNATLTLTVASILAVGLWAFAWYATSSYVQAQVRGWTEAQGARGAIASYETMEAGGFPSAVVVTVTKPRYAGALWAGLDAPRIDWQGDTLTLSTRVWTPWTFDIDAPGRHEIAFGDGARRYSGSAQDLRVSLNPGETFPESLSLAIKGLTLGGPSPLGARDLALDVHYDPSATGSAAGLALTMAAQELVLPLSDLGLDFGLGETLHTLEANVRITGPVVPGPLAERLEAWRAVGGALDIQSLKLRTDALAFASSGTLALDKNLQPVGAFTAKFEGLFQTLEVLRARGMIDGGDAVVATMALAALSKRPQNGGAPFINLAVGIQDGKVTLGPVKVFDLPRLNWGAAPIEAPGQGDGANAAQDAPRDFKDAPPVY